MRLNIVRLRYLGNPGFLAVTSVMQYVGVERKLGRYQRVLQLMLLLGQAGAIEVQRKAGDELASCLTCASPVIYPPISSG